MGEAIVNNVSWKMTRVFENSEGRTTECFHMEFDAGHLRLPGDMAIL